MNLLNSCINVLVNSFFRIFITLQIKIVKSSSKSFFICQSVKGTKIPCRKIVIYWSQSKTEIRKTNINMLKHNLISNQFCEYGKNIKMNASNIYWILIWHKMNPSNRGLLLLTSLFSCAPMMQDWSHNLSAVKYEGRPMNFYGQEPRGLIVASVMHKCNIGRLRCQPEIFNPFNKTLF